MPAALMRACACAHVRRALPCVHGTPSHTWLHQAGRQPPENKSGATPAAVRCRSAGIQKWKLSDKSRTVATMGGFSTTAWYGATNDGTVGGTVRAAAGVCSGVGWGGVGGAAGVCQGSWGKGLMGALVRCHPGTVPAWAVGGCNIDSAGINRCARCMCLAGCSPTQLQMHCSPLPRRCTP